MGNKFSEKWLPVPIDGFGEVYAISSYGRVRSLDRWVSPAGHIELWKGRIMNQHIASAGYLNVSMSYNGKSIREYVHRLVAMAFIPNPDNLPEVNHKDRNPLNNNVRNLEWCTHEYNVRYMRNEIVVPRIKPIEQYTLDGKLVARFESSADVNRKLGYGQAYIHACCLNRHKTAHGYIWKFAQEKV